MKQIQYIFIFLLMLGVSIPVAAQQKRTINGVVLDEKNEPIIGASVTVPGTRLGSITNMYGKFILSNVEADQKIIQISYIGYKTQKVDITNKTSLTIAMAETNNELNEVVAVGYATQKKAHLTGAIATVDPKELADLNTTDLASSLRGKVTGLSIAGGNRRPGESGSITIRKSAVMSSLSNISAFVPNNSPMYIIDDIQSDESQFNNLDPTMIESMSVLKDAAAAVYGSNSAYGVIIVKTKRGKIGAPKVSYNGQFGLTDEIQRAKLLDAYNYGKLWNAVYAAGATGEFQETDNKRNMFQANELEYMKKVNYDLLDQQWHTGLTQKHSVNITGGGENANYFAGISYVKQGANIGNIDYDRWNYRAGVDAKISNAIKVSFQASGDFSKKNSSFSKVTGSNGGETDYNYLLTHPRYIPEYVNGLPIATYGMTNSEINSIQNYNYNTIQNMGNNSQSVSQTMNLNANIEYDFSWLEALKGLKFKLTYGKNISTSKTNQFASKYYIYKFGKRPGIDNYEFGGHIYDETQMDMSSSNVTRMEITNGDILSRSMARGDNYQLNFTTTYGRKFGLHDVSGLFTIERSETESEDLSGSVSGLTEYANGQSVVSAIDPNNSGSTVFGRSESGRLSYAGRANYAYADKYLLELLFRVDASTKFAPENYWGFFPSLSTGWVLSEENWFKQNVKGIDFLKIRGSFGLLGRDNLKPWMWTQLYNSNPDKGPVFGTNPGTKTSSHLALQDDGINRFAHWDKNYQANIGIDLNAFDNRFSTGLDGYYFWGREIFATKQGTADYPATVGVKAAPENYGQIDRYGIELSLGWKDKIGDFKYNVKVSTEYADDKILVDAWPAQIAFDDVHPGQRNDVGVWGYECIGMFRSYQDIEEYFNKYHITSYMDKAKSDVRPGMLIYNNIRGSQKADGSYYGPNDPNDPNAGVVDKNDRILISTKSSNPFGFNLSLGGEWKGISFNARFSAGWGSYTYIPQYARGITSLITGTTGYDVLQYSNMPSYWADNMFVYSDVKDASGNVVVSQNLDAKYPNLKYGSVNNVESTFWRVSGTNISLNDLTIAYSLPKQIIKFVGIENCRLNVTGQDLLSFYNPYPDHFIDPMAGDYGKYPNLRKITIGVNVTF
ncbi:MAG: TonB-dependent receptor [Paludibacter sp.]|nr:TonB-dependent receptor [Paludibacter sp.]